MIFCHVNDLISHPTWILPAKNWKKKHKSHHSCRWGIFSWFLVNKKSLHIFIPQTIFHQQKTPRCNISSPPMHLRHSLPGHPTRAVQRTQPNISPPRKTSASKALAKCCMAFWWRSVPVLSTLDLGVLGGGNSGEGKVWHGQDKFWWLKHMYIYIYIEYMYICIAMYSYFPSRWNSCFNLKTAPLLSQEWCSIGIHTGDFFGLLWDFCDIFSVVFRVTPAPSWWLTSQAFTKKHLKNPHHHLAGSTFAEKITSKWSPRPWKIRGKLVKCYRTSPLVRKCRHFCW